MNKKLINILLIVLGIGIAYYLLTPIKSKKRVRFNLRPTYYGIPARKPPNLPVRWGYRGTYRDD